MKKLTSTNESFYAGSLAKIKRYLSENAPDGNLAHFFEDKKNFEIKSPFSRYLMVNGSYRVETIFAYHLYLPCA